METIYIPQGPAYTILLLIRHIPHGLWYVTILIIPICWSVIKLNVAAWAHSTLSLVSTQVWPLGNWKY